MNIRLALIIYLLSIFSVGCALVPASSNARPTPTTFRLPPTWTPLPPTPTPTAQPTATLVVHDTPAPVVATSNTFRRSPLSSNGIIGAWVDTTHFSPEFREQLKDKVQLVSGPQATFIRQLNARVFMLARLDATLTPTLTVSAQNLSHLYDGVLVEKVGEAAKANQLSAASTVLTSLRAALPLPLLFASTYATNDGAAYSQNTTDARALLQHVDGVCICNFMRQSSDGLGQFKEEVGWKKDVDALAALSASSSAMVLVATRFESVKEADRGDLQPWFIYALASFLLGANGNHTYFSFQGPRADDYMSRDEFGISLGAPLGGYYPSFGLYARRFAKGMVLVNAGLTAREMPLSRTYTTPLNQQLTRAILAPHTGIILLVVQ
jgi:hypothetical protein